MPADGEIQAAGAVAFRESEEGPEVLLVHRPRYDDWAFPKGKLHRGEPAPVGAIREVAEETGLRVALELPLPPQRYRVRGVPKRVHYWTARVLGCDDVAHYLPNDEIDQVAWLPLERAPELLTYRFDVETLQAATAAVREGPTVPLVVLRHAQAHKRKTWHGDDRRRPLTLAGQRQAVTVAGILAAYDVRRIVTSSSDRCAQTVAPYAALTGSSAEELDLLSEEVATERGIAEFGARLLAGLPESAGTVVCGHRPVLPWVFDALGIPEVNLAKGELLIAHRRPGERGSPIAAVERHCAE